MCRKNLLQKDKMKLKIAAVLIVLSVVIVVKVAQQNAEAKQLERGENEDFHFANFKEFLNHMLNVSRVLASIDVNDYDDCALKCLDNMECFSTNFAILPDRNSRLHVCHLLATDKYNNSSSFVPSATFHHYAIASPCESFPCQNGGTCRPLYNENDYVCDCRDGYNHGTHCEKGWLKINADQVCFGAKDDSYGTFNIQKPGNIYSFKLVHLSGTVTCNPAHPGTKWGCRNILNTHITDANNRRLFPLHSSTSSGLDGNLFYKLPEFKYNSTEIEFRFFSSPLFVAVGQEFRVWYGEDLINIGEGDNYGKSCIDVYGWYV